MSAASKPVLVPSRAPTRPRLHTTPAIGERAARILARPVVVLLAACLAAWGVPAWGQLTPVGPPPLAPPPPPPPPETPPGPPVAPAPGEPQPPAAPVAPPAPEPPPVTAPPPRAFEFIQRPPERPDPNLAINPADAPRRFLLRASLTEEFDDNIRMAPGGRKQADISTLFSVAYVYRLQTERSFISTANSVNARYSPIFEDRRSLTLGPLQNLNLVAGHQVTPRLTLGASGSIVRSTDLLQLDPASASRGGRSELTQTSFSPQASYALTERTSLTAGYANGRVTQKGNDRGTGDSTTDSFNTSLSHSLTARAGANIGFTYFSSRSGETTSTGTSLTQGLSYTVSPKTSLSLNGSAFQLKPQSGTSQKTFSLSAGVSHSFSPEFSTSTSVGLQRMEPGGRTTLTPTSNLSLTRRGPRYSLGVTASMSSNESIGQVNDVGRTRSQNLSVRYTYFPNRAWFFNLGASYGRTDFSQAQRASLIGVERGTVEKSYTMSAAWSYRLARFLSLALSYNLVVRDSTQPARDTSDNRVTFSVAGDYSR